MEVINGCSAVIGRHFEFRRGQLVVTRSRSDVIRSHLVAIRSLLGSKDVKGHHLDGFSVQTLKVTVVQLPGTAF